MLNKKKIYLVHYIVIYIVLKKMEKVFIPLTRIK